MLNFAKKGTSRAADPVAAVALTRTVEPTLLRTKHSRLVARVPELREEIERRREEEVELAVAAEKARAAAAEGSGDFHSLVAADERLAAVSQIIAAAESVLADVEAEAAKTEGEIRAAEHSAEAERQREAAAPLRAEADRLAEAFSESVLMLTEPLVKRRQIAEKIARDFPLAEPVPVVSLDAIADRLRAARTFHEYHAGIACRTWLLRLLYGPVIRQTEGDLLRDHHVR